MSASLARQFRLLKSAPRPLARCASTAATPNTPPPSDTPPSDPQTSRQNPAGLPRQAFTVPYSPVSRLSSFPNSFNSPAHKLYNHPFPLFSTPPEESVAGKLVEQTSMKEGKLSAISNLSRDDLRGLCRFTIRAQRVQHMTKKGKMGSHQAYVVVGCPHRGLLGLGRGRGSTRGIAQDAGFQQAVLNMDYVDKYEARTLWGEGRDLVGKWGAAQVHLRARPPGFGLMVPPMVHRVFSACGIKDASAMIVGSTNRPDVVKATIQVLHGGGNPSGFGTGIFGKKGPRENKGRGMKSKGDIERERGRYGVDIGRRV